VSSELEPRIQVLQGTLDLIVLKYGIAEDPGSSCGPLAVYMIRQAFCSGRSGTRFVSEKGAKVGRNGRGKEKLSAPDSGIGICLKTNQERIDPL
jgi:hypothetical protein